MGNMVKCKGCEKPISENAKVCPFCGEPAPKRTSIGTWLFLIIVILVFVAIGRMPTAEHTPTQTVAQTVALPTPKEESKNLVTIENFQGSKDVSGNILIAYFEISNDSEYAVKDIEIVCTHFAKSGTKIDSNKRVIYDEIEPYGNKTFDEFNMGFIHSQAEKSSCKVTDFQI